MRACDYRVFVIMYKTTFSERKQPSPGEDFELTGKTITEERKYFVVAPTSLLAIAAFKRYHSEDEVVSMMDAGQLDDLVYLQ